MKKVKRFYIVLAFTVTIIIILIGRLAHIQLISTESFSENSVNLIEASVKQRTQEMTIDDGRGKLISRNGQPLTSDKKNRLVLFPFLKQMDWPSREVAEIVNYSSYNLTKDVEKATKPIIFPKELTPGQMKQINDLKYPGIFALSIEQRPSKQLAPHLIGMVRQNDRLIREKYEDQLKKGQIALSTPIGITGLQASFDEFLLPEQESKLLYHVDRFGGPLFGIDVKYTGTANPFYPVNIKTTIDEDIQQMLEEVINAYNVKEGGAVLLDVASNELLGLVSKPHIHKSNPYEDKDRGIENRMLTPQVPGSVFKTVVAAAAVEEEANIHGRLFNCSLSIYGKRDAKLDRGLLNFNESFFQSCNYTFATLAKEMMKDNPKVLEDYAEKLGLTGPVSWNGTLFHFDNFKQLREEKSGTIWKGTQNKRIPNAIGQTAIGQLDVNVTPLAVANMMATIARGGEKYTVKVVDEIQYKNGGTLYEFKQQRLKEQTLKPYTVLQLQKLLRGVVTDQKGTGRRFQSLPYEVAGKSGTAEIGEHLTSVNKWFAGYFPVSNPKYALVVVELNTTSSNAATNAIFYDIVNNLYSIDKAKGN